MGSTTNTIRDRRVALGLTQQALADRVSVSRQTIGVIEGGAGSCGVELALRLAEALGCRVEELFAAPAPSVEAEPTQGEPLDAGTRVALSEIRGRLVARPLRGVQGGFWATAPAHGLVRGREAGGRVAVRRLRSGRRGVFVAGCDPAAGLLAEHASRARSALDAYWWSAGNGRAVAELARGSVHAVTVHQEPGYPRPRFGFDVERVRVASWEMGWIVAAGNPKGIVSPADLARDDVTLANREVGAGARKLLDDLLVEAGVATDQVRGYGRVFPGHAEVATAVELGVADVGLGIALAAHVEGLGFVPITRQACDLYVPRDELGSEPVQVLLETIVSGRFQAELSAFGPYDTSETGDHID
ncbi:MAG TPA: substrate-binding domain-containing protein [Trueperaceae bacterium]|nr:substrate-binding domain-containing protein [Trueperaceae bacterium]